mgnify:CR=1 FL=1
MKWEDFKVRVPGFINGMDEILPKSFDDLSNMIDDGYSKAKNVADILLKLKPTHIIPTEFILKIKECFDVINAATSEFNKDEDDTDVPAIWTAMNTVSFTLDAIEKQIPNLKLKEESSQ